MLRRMRQPGAIGNPKLEVPSLIHACLHVGNCTTYVHGKKARVVNLFSRQQRKAVSPLSHFFAPISSLLFLLLLLFFLLHLEDVLLVCPAPIFSPLLPPSYAPKIHHHETCSYPFNFGEFRVPSLLLAPSFPPGSNEEVERRTTTSQMMFVRKEEKERERKEEWWRRKGGKRRKGEGALFTQCGNGRRKEREKERERKESVYRPPPFSTLLVTQQVLFSFHPPSKLSRDGFSYFFLLLPPQWMVGVGERAICVGILFSPLFVTLRRGGSMPRRPFLLFFLLFSFFSFLALSPVTRQTDGKRGRDEKRMGLEAL